MYRCVTANGIDGEVICIGNDENQANKNYNDIGVYCDFTFEAIPELTEELKTYVHENMPLVKPLLKVVNHEVVCKALVEVQ